MQDPALARTGAKVKELRLAAELSQQTLATRAGVALRTLTRVEQGEDTRFGTLAALAAGLGVDVSALTESAVEPTEAAS